MKAFCTGSRVYGVSREDSDIDLVVTVSERDFELLCQHGDGDTARILEYSGAENGQLKFGKLNLICVSEAQMPAWKEATDSLEAVKPVTRETAISVIDDKLVAHGQPARTRAA